MILSEERGSSSATAFLPRTPFRHTNSESQRPTYLDPLISICYGSGTIEANPGVSMQD